MAYLKAAGFEIELAEPQQVWLELCWSETPVQLKAVPISTRHEAAVQLTDEPILACRFAGSLDRGLVAPLIAGTKQTELTAVRTGDKGKQPEGIGARTSAPSPATGWTTQLTAQSCRLTLR
ncbi:hypothetical protein JKG68_31220 [Microvirga aerilata]|uniref:Uncharacterized protein n=1 Tax=Microvirga aerilata TaxID=670292 RepID=A0A937D572_9HYPH|nr:hypothetical protein [Microvirga aerilata]MBL0408345.1 hypothetical protein [Microvirga aerilata]